MVANIDLDLWNEYLGDAPMAMVLIDRLMERAIIMQIKNAKSYREHSARLVSPAGAKKTSQAASKPAQRKR